MVLEAIRLNTLGRKTVALIVLSLLITAAITGVLVGDVVRERTLTQLESVMDSESQETSIAISSFVAEDDIIMATQVMRSELIREDVAYVGLLDGKGNLLIEMSDEGISKGDIIVRKQPVVYQQEEVGTLVLGFSRQYIRDVVNDALRTLISSLVEMFLLLGLLMYLLLRREVIKPISGFVSTIEQISFDDLTKRVPIHKSDEVGRLAAAFNHMLDNLQLSQEQLKESEEKYRTLVETSVSGVFMVQDGRLVFVNQAFVDIFGYKSHSELVGRSMEELVAPESADAVREKLGRQEVVEKSTKLRAVALTSHGSHIWCEIMMTPVSFEGRPAMMGTLLDITERVEHEKLQQEYTKKLEEANTELERLDKLKSDFMYIASHELRTPLFSLMGNLEFMMEKLSLDDAKMRRRMEVIWQSAFRLSEVVGAITDALKIESGKLKVKHEPVVVNDVVESSITAMEVYAEQRNQKIVYDAIGDYVVAGDREYLLTVMNNLLTNAIKYTPDEGEITVGVLDEGNNVHVYVRDTGIGIPEEEFERIFGRFYEVGESMHHHTSLSKFKGGGAGLGLYIVKNIVELHRGKIWVESMLNVGSTFHFILPKFSTDVEEGDYD